jgi:hypothetical protein
MRDELDLSIGFQHSGAILLPVGDRVHCPNQAAMLQDLSAWWKLPTRTAN